MMNAVSKDASMDDAALVQAARSGDKRALATLLERHWRMLFALCMRALGNRTAAEDACQEAALQALLGIQRLRRDDRFGPWLGGIGLNICRQQLRERGHTSWETLCGVRQGSALVAPQAGPHDAAEATEVRERVRHALAELPRGQRAAVLLYYLSGLTQADVAAYLGIDVGAVKTRLHKARGTLRRQLWTEWKEQRMARESESQPVAMAVAYVLHEHIAPDAPHPKTHVVVLKEIKGTRYLPIWIGAFEGQSIAHALQKLESPRPLTHAFMANMLGALDARLEEVRVNKLVDEVFYAIAVLASAAGQKMIDARPSDALMLAVICNAPIRVEPAVLETARIEAPPMDGESEEEALRRRIATIEAERASKEQGTA